VCTDNHPTETLKLLLTIVSLTVFAPGKNWVCRDMTRITEKRVSEHEARSGIMLRTRVEGSGEELFRKANIHHCGYCRLIPGASSGIEGGSVIRLPSRRITREPSVGGGSL
jgi:hypothetical protein